MLRPAGRASRHASDTQAMKNVIPGKQRRESGPVKSGMFATSDLLREAVVEYIEVDYKRIRGHSRPRRASRPPCATHACSRGQPAALLGSDTKLDTVWHGD